MNQNHLFIGNSPQMHKVYQIISQIAKSNVSVLITGETGTGKELCAKAIHQMSLRQSKAFMTLNCATLSHHLMESELYGHVKGAFTGATHEKTGIAQAADQGTLFLDEIGEMEFELQSKLLRFIETGTFYPVGSHHLKSVDIRFVAATNRELQLEIEAGRFRSDIYYRLKTIAVHLPPLRERGADIVLLAQHFLQKLAQQEQKAFHDFTADAREILLAYDWPGNVRQLQNLIHGIVLLNEGEQITANMLTAGFDEWCRSPQPSTSTSQASISQTNLPVQNSDPAFPNLTVAITSGNTVRPYTQIEQETLLKALYFCRGHVVEAADSLQISQATLYRKLRAWNIPVKKIKKSQKYRSS